MKSILLSAVLMLSATASFAQSSGTEYDDYYVTILAWCQDDKIMSDKSNGTTEVYRDCAASGQVCHAMSLEQMSRTILTATCK